MVIGPKLLLAGLSGFLVSLVWITLAGIETGIGVLVLNASAGSLFAAGVLLPYLKRQDLISWRSAGLVFISGVSFYCAVHAAIEWSSGKWGPNGEDFVVASFVGAVIVLLLSPLILTLRFSVKYAIVGVLAALAGGIAFGILDDLFVYSWFLSFGVWHMLMCVTLHFANPTAAEGGWFASVGKAKFRLIVASMSLFVIVPLLDDGIGALLQNRYTAHDGGIRVHERVEARGFRDERNKPMFAAGGCGFGCISRVVDETYAFQEYVVDHADGRYQIFFIGDIPDINCYNYPADWNSPFEATFNDKPKPDKIRCLTYRLKNEATAELVIRDDAETIHTVFGLYSLRKTSRKIIRLSDDKVVTEASYFLYHSRFLEETFGAVPPWDQFLKQALPPVGRK